MPDNKPLGITVGRDGPNVTFTIDGVTVSVPAAAARQIRDEVSARADEAEAEPGQ